MLNSWFGIPFFILVMIGVFWLTFGYPGTLIKDYFDLFLNFGIDILKDIIISLNLIEMFTKLINNGILDALAGVFAFIPQIIILFFFIALMEDVGLIGRAAFMTDAFMRRFGLSGRAFIPMILGFGCTVPAILSTRTIPDKRDRIVTALAVPFISCGARLPVYSLIAAAFFREKAFIVIAFLYILGFVVSLITSLLFKKSIMRGETSPLIFELPPYRIPGFRNIRTRLFETAWDFISRLITLILLASIVMWALQNFTLNLQITSDPELSIMAELGRFFAPFFEPIGFGDWQRVSALLAGLAAKETIIAAFEIIYGGSNIALLAFNTPSALSFMVFVLLYVPCIAAVSAMYKEFEKKRYVVISLIWQIFISWISAFIIFNFAKIMGW
jgi:ferrous iron transport protein B